MQCTFGNAQWESMSIDQPPAAIQWIMERMSRFKARVDGATVNILDMSYKEVKIKFRTNAIVGVANGMFYCDSSDVSETKIADAPAEYTKPTPSGITE
jgi:hypothetical protein